MIRMIAVACLLWSIIGLAQQKKGEALGDVESILDQLERRLEDQESQVLTFDEQRIFKEDAPKKAADRSLKFKGSDITSNLDADRNLQQLSQAITELETEIDQLDSQVQLSRQKVLEDAKLDNFIEVDGAVASSDSVALRALTVKIDDYEVYKLDESNGLWVPSSKVPFYAGPVPPGKHTIRVDARLVKKNPNTSALPLNASTYETITKEEQFLVPEGAFKKRITINLAKEDQ